MTSILSIQIQKHSKIILGWTILSNYGSNDSFIDLFKKLQKEHSLQQYSLTCAKIGTSKTSSFDNVELDVKVLEAVNLFGRFVRYYIDNAAEDKNIEMVCGGNTSNTKEPETKKSAFDVLMNASKQLHLPEKYEIDRIKIRNNLLVYNKIIELLEIESLGFTTITMESGKNFVRLLTDCIWYIDPHLKRMEQRGCRIPLKFEDLRGYNKPERTHHKVHCLSRETILQHASNLDHVLGQTWISSPVWKPIKSAVESLTEMLYKYSDYLKNQTEKTVENQQQMRPIRCTDEGHDVQVILPRLCANPNISSRYKSLNEHLA